MAYAKMKHFGHTLSFFTGGSYAVVAGVEDVDPDGYKIGEIDDTELPDDTESHSPGRLNNGSLKVSFGFDPSDTTHLAIETAARARATGQKFKLLYKRGFATEPFIEFTGFFTKFQETGYKSKSSGNIMAECEMKVNTVTRTAGTP